MKLGLSFAAVALLAASSAASAQSVEVVTQFGPQVQPVVINQSSQFNVAAVLQVTSSGSPSATIKQTGTTNVVGIMQFGGLSSSEATGQSGVVNVADIGQVGNTTSSLLTQMGNLNTGAITQIGMSNSAFVSQSNP
jgi:minor curlin subunit